VRAALVVQQQSETFEAGAGVVRRQQGAMPGEARPFLEMKVGDNDGEAARPDQSAACIGRQVDAVEGDRQD
jgi:hypothetical protein